VLPRRRDQAPGAFGEGRGQQVPAARSLKTGPATLATDCGHSWASLNYRNEAVSSFA